MKEKKKIPQVAVIVADDPEQLQTRINQELMIHPDYTSIDVTENRAVIQYLVTVQELDPVESLPCPDELAPVDHRINLADNGTERNIVHIEITLPVPADRYCCECENYNWGIGCQYRDGHVRILDEACEMFNLRIGFDDFLTPIEQDPARQKKRQEQRKAAIKFYSELRSVVETDIYKRKLYFLESPDTGSLANKPLLPEEIALIEYGSREALTEDQIIEVAKNHHAWEVCTLEDAVFIDEDTMTWEFSECIYEREQNTGEEA